MNKREENWILMKIQAIENASSLPKGDGILQI